MKFSIKNLKEEFKSYDCLSDCYLKNFEEKIKKN